MTAFMAAVALVLLTFAIVRRDGLYDVPSLIAVLASLAVSIAGVCRRWSSEREAWAARALPWILALIAIGNLARLFHRTPGVYVTSGISLVPFRAGVAMAVALVASYAIPRGRMRWFEPMRLPALVAIYLALGAWMIQASPTPRIDVWHFQERAADLLLHGENPWAADYPNIYGHAQFTSPALMAEGRIRSFPYPPLSLLLSTLGALAGDVRWALLAATAGAVVLIVAAARRCGMPPGHIGELAPIALLFHARGFFMIEQAWTEPFVALATAGTVWALAAQRQTAIATTIAALLSLKQYAVLLVPALWRHGRVRPRILSLAAALAALIALPFALWNLRALWEGVVVYQLVQPTRADALSVPAFWVRSFGAVPWQGLGLVMAVLTAVLCAFRAPRETDGSPATMALAGAATYLAFFVFSKQAFFNYYWFVSVLLVIAVAVSAASRSGASSKVTGH